MPNIRKIITCALLLCLSHCFFNMATAQPFFTEEKPLHSAINGKEITRLTFSVEQKKPSEYILTIENKQNNPNTEIWIFHKDVTANKGKLPGYPWEVEGVNKIMPFCSGGQVNVPIADTKNIRSQEKLPLSGALSEGKTITLTMNFYIVTKTKKKTVLDNHATVRLTFTLPDTKKTENSKDPKKPKTSQDPNDEKSVTTLPIDTELVPADEEPTPEEIEALQQHKADSLRDIRIADLDAFISEKNAEMEAQLEKIEELEAQNQKIEEAIVAPIEKEVKRLQKNVGFRENSAEIAENETLRNKFSDFSLMYEEAMEKIQLLRQEPPAPPPTNWMMYIGIALGGLFVFGMLAMQVMNQIKMKRQQRQQQLQQRQQQKEMEKEMRRQELENIDENIENI